jgi:hypothetical protein
MMAGQILKPKRARLITRRRILGASPGLILAPALVGCSEEFQDFLIKAAKAVYAIVEEVAGNGELEYCGDGGQFFDLVTDLISGSKSESNSMVASTQQAIQLEVGMNDVQFGGLVPQGPGVHFVRGTIGRIEAETEEFMVEM